VRERCPAPEDLTAHAHGEGGAAQRAAFARHLLACADCRARHDDDARLLLDLKALGAARASVAPLPVAPRPGRAAWLAFAPPAAAALLIATALLLPGREPDVPAAPAVGPLSPRLERLIAAQASDGHWEAEQGPVGTVAEAATGLVLLALQRETEGGSRSPALTESRGRAGRWLAEQVLDPAGARRLAEAGTAAQAVALAALTEEVGGPLGVNARLACEVLLDGLGRAAESPFVLAAARPWLDYALARAEARSLAGARETRRTLALAREPDRFGRPASPLPRPSGLVVEDCTPLRLALEALRDEAPVRALALGPACRLGDL
jgi:hypothetical protein